MNFACGVLHRANHRRLVIGNNAAHGIREFARGLTTGSDSRGTRPLFEMQIPAKNGVGVGLGWGSCVRRTLRTSRCWHASPRPRPRRRSKPTAAQIPSSRRLPDLGSRSDGGPRYGTYQYTSSLDLSPGEVVLSLTTGRTPRSCSDSARGARQALRQSTSSRSANGWTPVPEITNGRCRARPSPSAFDRSCALQRCGAAGAASRRMADNESRLGAALGTRHQAAELAPFLPLPGRNNERARRYLAVA